MQLIGYMNGVAAIMGILMISILGRRTLLILGHVAMTLIFIFCGFAILYDYSLSAYISILLFIMFFHFSHGTVTWLYTPEVTVDAASGFALAGQFINLSIIALTFEFMLAGPLDIYGTIWYHACWNFVGLIFMVVFVKETRGLTDKEKKLLYSPIFPIGNSEQELENV